MVGARVGLAFVLVAALAGSLPGMGQAPPLKLELVADGFSAPLLATHAGDGSGRLFVVEQTGLVRVVADGAVDPTPYMDLAARVSCCGERGLLGLAFHPRFEENGVLFASYTRAGDGASALERFIVASPSDGRPPATGEVLLVQPQPFENHNGGHVAFGPDGYLYYALGDGGSGGDPQNNAQDLGTLLGKMLRLDVEAADGYAVPPTNPFLSTPDARPEIWALGLRNPWRFSFDRLLGDLWIGDVGQNAWEEVDHQLRTSPGGENYAWNWWEGNHEFRSGAPREGMTFPAVEYSHQLGCSVTGGHVYRGTGVPWLSGAYLYGDFCSGRVWGAYALAKRVYVPLPLMDTDLLVSSFGEDEAGEVYVVDYGGAVYRLAA